MWPHLKLLEELWGGEGDGLVNSLASRKRSTLYDRWRLTREESYLKLKLNSFFLHNYWVVSHKVKVCRCYFGTMILLHKG